MTTSDEVGDPNALGISCSVNDVQYQNSTTGDMIFRVPEIVSYLSTIVELRPGDLIFTGSPTALVRDKLLLFFSSLATVW